MARRKSHRSQLYRVARDLGKPRAARDGGVKGLAKRDARRIAYPKTNTVIGSLLGALGWFGNRRKR